MADEYPRLICPIPSGLAATNKGKLPRNRKGADREHIWAWKDAAGFVLKVTIRFHNAEKGKVVLPYTLWEIGPGRYEWMQRDLPPPRPLYGLDRLAARPDVPTMVHEGEKACDAAEKVFPEYVHITSGSCTSAGKADWEPLRGRSAYGWPDHDEPGGLYIQDVGILTKGLVSTFSVVQVPDEFPAKWDLADHIPEGWNVERLRELIVAATDEPQGRGARRSTPGLPSKDESAEHSFVHPKLPLPGAWIKGDVGRYLLEDPPPVEWLVEGLIPSGVPGILAARAGVGKSSAALLAGMGLASGLAVLGRQVGKDARRGVLFVGLEDDEAEFHRRFRRAVELLQEDPNWSEAQEEALCRRLVPLFPNRASGATFNLEGQRKALGEAAEAIPGGCGLIILDTLSRMADGDENKACDMRPFNEAASALAQVTGAAVLSIHHVGKGNDTPSDKKLWERLHPEALRGSSAVEAAARFILQMAALSPSEAQAAGLEGEDALRGAYVALHLSKISSAAKGDTILLERRQGGEAGAGFLTLHPESDRVLAVIQGEAAILKLNRKEQVLLAIAEAGSLKDLDQKFAAASLWPDSSNPKGQWDKILSVLRKAGWINPPNLTDVGWAKAETLGFASSVRKAGRADNSTRIPETLDLPPGRGEAEETEDIPSFHSKALGNRNGRKELPYTPKSEELVV